MNKIRPTGILKMNKVKVPTIQLELDDALNRRCSILFPEKNSESAAEQIRKDRKQSFATFQIVDENNCGMFMFIAKSEMCKFKVFMKMYHSFKHKYIY